MIKNHKFVNQVNAYKGHSTYVQMYNKSNFFNDRKWYIHNDRNILKYIFVMVKVGNTFRVREII